MNKVLDDSIRNYKWKDLTGIKFGKLTAIEYKPCRDKNNKRIYRKTKTKNERNH